MAHAAMRQPFVGVPELRVIGKLILNLSDHLSKAELTEQELVRLGAIYDDINHALSHSMGPGWAGKQFDEKESTGG